MKKNDFQKFLDVFIVSFVIMSLEIVIIRILTPFFGNSIYVTSTIIGLTFIFMSIGYFYGGNISKKKHSYELYIFIAFVYLSFIILFHDFILIITSKFNIIIGSFLSASIMMGIPIIFLSISPILIINNSIQKKELSGLVAGKIYMLGTLGGLFGIITTSFIFIQFFGSSITLKIITLSLLLTFFRKSFSTNKKITIILLIILILLSRGFNQTFLYEKDSLYNNLKILQTNNSLVLLMNKNYQHTIQSQHILTQLYYDIYNIGPLLTNVNKTLILGLGGGTIVKQKNYFYNQSQIDVVELDPEVIKISKKYFDVKENEKITFFQDDARRFLIKNIEKYDEIDIDVFTGEPMIPVHLTTKEFFIEVFNDLNNEGILIMNFANKNNVELFSSLISTIQTVFPSVYYIPIFNNIIIIGLKEKTDINTIRQKLDKNKILALENIINYSKNNMLLFNSTNKILTDDYAPVERFMLKNYLNT